MSQTPGPHYCHYHPSIETELRCNKCGRYICPKDAVRTPVGYRCKGCVKEQQDVFFNATPIDYGVAAVVSFVLSFIAALIVPSLGFFAIFGAPIAGAVISEGVRLVNRKRRGRYIWAVVMACMIVTAAMRVFSMPEVQWALALGLSSEGAAQLLGGLALSLVWMIVYLVIAGGIVIARLRFLKIG
ncbi:hypothetical protein TFLX_04767 [Thermoflexales bacterium]|nr:hypothetical protein TFLX_04767 [Thermoflexales bacterium]